MNKLALVCILVFTIVVLPIASGCAEAIFEVSNLTISTQEVESGESATVYVDITNTGGAEGTYTVVLRIDGVETDNSNVTVAAGTTLQASFSITREEAGDYSIDVNGLTTTLKVLKPAEFEVKSLVVSPPEVTKGGSCTVTVEVVNIGDVAGEYEVALKVNDEIVDTEMVTLAAGATETVSFALSESKSGTYTVNIADLSGTLVVKTPPSPPPLPSKPASATFLVTNLIATQAADVSETSYDVSIDIQNTGGLSNVYTLRLEVNDEEMKPVEVQLNAGEKQTVALTEAQTLLYSLAMAYKKGWVDSNEYSISVLPSRDISTTVTFPELAYKLQFISISCRAINHCRGYNH
ncbi:CARDB domain-containing protein [Chloroflexota bacterium]